MNTVILKDERKLVWEATGWCIDKFGIDSIHFLNGKWYCRKHYAWDQHYREFCFQHKSDAIEFALRWS